MVAAILGVAALVAPRPAAAASHAITRDAYSLMIDGQRTFLWSGEFHPFRLVPVDASSFSIWYRMTLPLPLVSWCRAMIASDPELLHDRRRNVVGLAVRAGGLHVLRPRRCAR
ncbi:MAG: hypothetical protein E6J91_05915 [Deltaproteobacteria bacterium]|nr:MAG: hypothetical protein E6J91_05915 [Deltaproteobacteria bacterium]